MVTSVTRQFTIFSKLIPRQSHHINIVQLVLQQQSNMGSLQFSRALIIIPNPVRCSILKPDRTPTVDEAKDIEPVNGIGEIPNLSHLVPEDSQITAAVEAISITTFSKIEAKRTALTSNEYIATYCYSPQSTEKDDVLGNTQSKQTGGHYVKRLGTIKAHN